MQKGPGRFELILNLPEVIALFFVMVALFTGLLFFGYRVGYSQSAKATSSQPRPAEPAQQSPHVEQQAPAPEVEPEIRLENSPASPGDPLFAPAEAGSSDPAGPKALARQAGEGQRRPCKADSYLSFLQKTLPATHRLSERFAEWAGARGDGATRSWQEPAADPEPAIASESTAVEPQGRETEAVDCSAPVDPRASRSLAC